MALITPGHLIPLIFFNHFDIFVLLSSYPWTERGNKHILKYEWISNVKDYSNIFRYHRRSTIFFIRIVSIELHIMMPDNSPPWIHSVHVVQWVIEIEYHNFAFNWKYRVPCMLSQLIVIMNVDIGINLSNRTSTGNWIISGGNLHLGELWFISVMSTGQKQHIIRKGDSRVL